MRKSKLLGKMAEVDITQRDLAKAIGMSENTMTSRIKGTTDFKANEIVAICKVCGISSADQIAEIFL